MTSCFICQRLPASIDAYVGSSGTFAALCPDCFWWDAINPRLNRRQQLLESLSENETSLQRALERIAPAGRLADGSYRSILHRCVCGHVAETWLALHCHLQKAGPGHGYSIREIPKTDETICYCLCQHKELSHHEAEAGDAFPCIVLGCKCTDFRLSHKYVLHGETIAPKRHTGAKVVAFDSAKDWSDATEEELL